MLFQDYMTTSSHSFIYNFNLLYHHDFHNVLSQHDNIMNWKTMSIVIMMAQQARNVFAHTIIVLRNINTTLHGVVVVPALLICLA